MASFRVPSSSSASSSTRPSLTRPPPLPITVTRSSNVGLQRPVPSPTVPFATHSPSNQSPSPVSAPFPTPSPPLASSPSPTPGGSPPYHLDGGFRTLRSDEPPALQLQQPSRTSRWSAVFARGDGKSCDCSGDRLVLLLAVVAALLVVTIVIAGLAGAGILSPQRNSDATAAAGADDGATNPAAFSSSSPFSASSSIAVDISGTGLSSSSDSIDDMTARHSVTPSPLSSSGAADSQSSSAPSSPPAQPPQVFLPVTPCVPPANLTSYTQVAASCGVPYNNTACPLPPWGPTWNLTLSTTFYGFTPAGMVLPAANKPWGLIPLDHEVAEILYGRPDMMQANAQATLIHNCQLIKSQHPQTRCFVYHNTEVALQYFESDRAVMYDNATAGFFLQVPSGQIYNDGGYGTQFFWDWRNLSAIQYIVASVVNITLNPWVDGIYSDDVNGLPNEHGDVQPALNMTNAEVAVNAYCAQTGWLQQLRALIANGKYDWAGFANAQGDGIGGEINAANCNYYFSQRCNAASQQTTLTQTFDWYNANQSIASFLIVRPPIAFLGWGFPSNINNWHPSFLYNVGEPLGLCYSPAPNVYTRAWTYGNVTMNCASFTASIPTGPTHPTPSAYVPPTVWALPLQSDLVETVTGLSATFALTETYGLYGASPVFSNTSRGSAWNNYPNGNYIGVILLPYQIGFLSTSYSLAFWVQYNGVWNLTPVCAFVAGGTLNNQNSFGGSQGGFAGGFLTWLTPSYQLASMHGPGIAPLVSVQLTQQTVKGCWTHVAVTFDETSGSLSLYVNGTLRNATSGNAQWTGTSQITLGYLQGLASAMEATMQQFHWANFAMTPQQVQQLASQ